MHALLINLLWCFYILVNVTVIEAKFPSDKSIFQSARERGLPKALSSESDGQKRNFIAEFKYSFSILSKWALNLQTRTFALLLF